MTKKKSKKNVKRFQDREKKKPKGMGDVVETVLEKTGVAKVAKWIMGDDCGCNERRDKLNKMFPFRNAKCLTEDEYDFLHLWFAKARHKITHDEHQRILDIYNRVFSEKHKISQCSSCIKTKVQELNRLYLEYTPNEND